MKVLNENDTRSGLEAPVPLTHRRRPGLAAPCSCLATFRNQTLSSFHWQFTPNALSAPVSGSVLLLITCKTHLLEFNLHCASGHPWQSYVMLYGSKWLIFPVVDNIQTAVWISNDTLTWAASHLSVPERCIIATCWQFSPEMFLGCTQSELMSGDNYFRQPWGLIVWGSDVLPGPGNSVPVSGASLEHSTSASL